MKSKSRFESLRGKLGLASDSGVHLSPKVLRKLAISGCLLEDYLSGDLYKQPVKSTSKKPVGGK